MTPEAYHPSQRQQELPSLPIENNDFPIPSAEQIDAAVPELLTHLAEHPFAKVEQASLGDIQLAYGTWGERRNNSWLRNAAERMGLLTPETRETLKNAGFPDGYYYSQDADMFLPKFQAIQALRGAMLAKTVVNERGWTHIHTLTLGSVSSVADTPKRVATILAQWGITVDNVQFYGQACNGAVAAIVDLTRLAQQGEDVGPSVVVGLESLSGRQADPKDIKITRTFGNGGGAVAFIPGQEIEHVTGRTIFAKDEEGVIKIHRIYELPTEGKKPLYPWYEVTEGSEDAIVQTDAGIFVRMIAPEGPFAQMNGRATFRWFGRHMPELITDVLLRYAEDFGNRYGRLWRWSLGHQPSKPVNTGLANRTNGILESIHENGKFMDSTVDKAIAQYLPKRISIPWLMKKAGVNNISAGTFLVHATEMVNRERIKLHRPTLLVGYGIGSVMQADVVIFH